VDRLEKLLGLYTVKVSSILDVADQISRRMDPLLDLPLTWSKPLNNGLNTFASVANMQDALNGTAMALAKSLEGINNTVYLMGTFRVSSRI
jgi:hypothetical protein